MASPLARLPDELAGHQVRQGAPSLVLPNGPRYAALAIPLLRTVIAQHLEAIRLCPGEGLLLSNTRWLHGRDRYIGPRTILRILGDPLPGTGIMPGFPSSAPAPGAQTPRAA